MNWKLFAPLAALVFLVSCAAVPGPPIPLGLGPGADDIVMLVLIIGLVIVAWRVMPSLLSRYRGPAATHRSGETAYETAHVIARERYARGEITRDEFLRISQDLHR